MRLLLALSVVSVHSRGLAFGWGGVGGQLAVQLFYMISGFLITVVLYRKYATPDRLWLFYSNRFLRIWIPYITVAVATVVLMKIGSKFGGYMLGGSSVFSRSALQSFDPLSLFAVIATNLLLLGQDLGMWLGYDSAKGLYFTAQFSREPIQFNQFYIIDQSWTLGLELTFYLLAPFLVRRHWIVILLLLGASVAARLLTYAAGFDFDPWTYRFFPFELALFLAGALAARFYLSTGLAEAREPNLPARLFAFAAVAAVATWSYMPDMMRSTPALFALVAAALPFLFATTKDWKVDRFLGSMSYPVYLVHIPITLLIRSWHLEDVIILSGYVLIPLSLGLAVVLARYIEAPLDQIRQRRVSGDAPPALRPAE